MINPDMESLPVARVVLAIAVVAALLALMAFVLNYVKTRGLYVPGATNSRRLQLIESLPLDARRRLVLVRCDQKEHLLLLGVNEDMLIAAAAAKSSTALQTKSKA